MRSLFFKIFFSFWLTIVLMGLTFYLVTVSGRPRPSDPTLRFFANQALDRFGEEALQSLAGGGQVGLSAYVEQLKTRNRINLYLFADGKPVLGQRQQPQWVAEYVARLAAGELPEFHPRPGIGFRLGKRLASTDGVSRIIVLHVPTPDNPAHGHGFPPPEPMITQNIAFLLAGGIVCYLLTRSLTAPIRRLREATNRIAGGDFSARVGAGLAVKGRGDEVADLGRDFDTMAQRIEGLVESQRRLVSDISHELRSPLARLKVALEIARQRADAAAASPLTRIETEADRLNQLIGELMTLNMLESGTGNLRQERVDLQELVGAVVADADFEARSRQRRVRLTASAAAEIVGCREMLRRAVENVVRNSVLYTAPDTEVGVTLEVRGAAGGETAVVRVRDHGPGIPAADLANICKPFYRVAEARDRESGGTGLGLSIAERAVRLHAGSLTAHNCAGGGLVVELEMPLKARG